MTPVVEATFGAEALGKLRRRAEQAAAAGEETFAFPEGAPVAARVAAVAPPGPLRTEAEGWLAAGARYDGLVRLAARAVAALVADAPERRGGVRAEGGGRARADVAAVAVGAGGAHDASPSPRSTWWRCARSRCTRWG